MFDQLSPQTSAIVGTIILLVVIVAYYRRVEKPLRTLLEQIFGVSIRLSRG